MPKHTNETTEVHTLKINTIYNFAEPKQWVTLPLFKSFDGYVVVFDAYGNKIKIVTNAKLSDDPMFD